MIFDKRDLVPLEAAGKHSALVLNADYRPLSLWPLKVYRWQDSVRLLHLDRVDVVEYHQRVVRSPSTEMQLPSIVVLREYVRRRQWPPFTKPNIFTRDQFCCGYCGRKFPYHELTRDHVIPKSRGGPTSWENIISACFDCNTLKKQDRTPHEAGMTLQWRPWRPTQEELHKLGRRYPPGSIPPGWRRYIGEDELAA